MLVVAVVVGGVGGAAGKVLGAKKGLYRGGVGGGEGQGAAKCAYRRPPAASTPLRAGSGSSMKNKMRPPPPCDLRLIQHASRSADLKIWQLGRDILRGAHVICTIRCLGFLSYSYSALIWEFPKIRGTLFWCPYNKDPTI